MLLNITEALDDVNVLAIIARFIFIGISYMISQEVCKKTLRKILSDIADSTNEKVETIIMTVDSDVQAENIQKYMTISNVCTICYQY